MRIELRNIKYAAFASQETSCFEATVYIDGTKAGTVSNEGHGGCNWYHPNELEARLTTHAKTLPPAKVEGYGELEYDADLLVGELLEAALLEKDFKRDIKSKVLYVKADGHLYSAKPKKPHTVQTYLDNRAKIAWLANAQVLNLLPPAEAFKIYREKVAA